MPRPSGETVHSARPGQMLRFDHLHFGASEHLKGEDLDKRNGFIFIMVTMDSICHSL